MKKVRAAIIFLMAISLLDITLTHSRPNIPIEELSEEIPNDMRNMIKILYSSNEKKIIKVLDYFGRNRERSYVAVPFLLSMLNNHLNDDNEEFATIRLKLIAALGNIGDKSAVKLLLTALEHKDGDVRGEAIAALGMIGDKRAIEPIMKFLREDKHTERAIDAFVHIGEPAVTPLLNEFNGHDKKIRTNVAFTLGELRSHRAVEPLIEGLKDPDIKLAKTCAFSLGTIMDKRAVEPLLDELKSDSLDMRLAAAIALSRIQDPRAVEPLIKELHDKEKSIRINAIRSLGVLKDSRAVEPLIVELEKGDWNIKRYTKWSLKNITGKNFGNDAKAWRKWYEASKSK